MLGNLHSWDLTGLFFRTILLILGSAWRLRFAFLFNMPACLVFCHETSMRRISFYFTSPLLAPGPPPARHDQFTTRITTPRERGACLVNDHIIFIHFFLSKSAPWYLSYAPSTDHGVCSMALSAYDQIPFHLNDFWIKTPASTSTCALNEVAAVCVAWLFLTTKYFKTPAMDIPRERLCVPSCVEQGNDACFSVFVLVAVCVFCWVQPNGAKQKRKQEKE